MTDQLQQYAIIDVETTGLSPKEDRVIEISVLKYDGREIVDRFTTLVNPEIRLSPGIVRLTGIDNSLLKDAPKFYEIARKIVTMTDGAIIIGHNVRFDYAFLRHEFSRLGYRYVRKHLCTMRLSRKIMPGLPSYRLSILAKRLGLALPGHRAEKDAETTLALLKSLEDISIDEEDDFAGMLQTELKTSVLPAGISREKIQTLPEETGIYFFYDIQGQLLYVGKSLSVRKRVLGHFSNDMSTSKSQKMKALVRDIDFIITGSELVALLLESDFIKSEQPPFNRSQRNVKYRYGLVASIDKKGYHRLSLDHYGKADDPLMAFSNRAKAENYVLSLVKKYELCQKMAGIDKSKEACFQYHLKACHGACVGAESPDAYNARVKDALQRFNYPSPTFAIIGEGRSKRENSVVLVENGIYQGFGFVGKRKLKRELDFIRPLVKTRPDNQDIRKIINSYLNRKTFRDELIDFDAG